MATQSWSAPKSREAQRQAYVDEFKALFDGIGGAEFAVAATPKELVDKAMKHGADERQVSSILALQQSFQEIEQGVSRMQSDPAYAAAVERGAVEFDEWVERASRSKKGAAYRLGRILGALLR